MPWTRERLEQAVCERLDGARLIVVANREPYIHTFDGDDIRWTTPASGLTSALDPVMRACGGTWVAHASGDADRAASDPRGCVRVPPDRPAYTLKRVWLSKEEEQGYYYGFANEALWPLCHVAYTRPRFDARDWLQYRAVNRRFAKAVLEEVREAPAIVFVQDYHFALLPRMLREARPDLVVVQFWHIPWPNRETFRVCPWQEEILDGLLGNDLLSFHARDHCNNFLDTVDRGIESRVDAEQFSVTRNGRATLVQPHPISVDPDGIVAALPADLAHAERRLRTRLRLRDEKLIVGVDRVDYTKGIPERFRAIDRLLELHPELKATFCLVQIGAPSRTHIGTYRRLNDELRQLADEINWRHATAEWRPIVFLNEHATQSEVFLLDRIATACVVTSLHDGMNLVAKEFVATRTDGRGVLVLSRFAGAARELGDALLINPYAIDECAEALRQALTMSAEEQQQRMTLLRRQVEDNNIFRWAGMVLSECGKIAQSRQLESKGFASLTS